MQAELEQIPFSFNSSLVEFNGTYHMYDGIPVMNKKKDRLPIDINVWVSKFGTVPNQSQLVGLWQRVYEHVVAPFEAVDCARAYRSVNRYCHTCKGYGVVVKDYDKVSGMLTVQTCTVCEGAGKTDGTGVRATGPDEYKIRPQDIELDPQYDV
jgi:hypothetical protein